MLNQCEHNSGVEKGCQQNKEKIKIHEILVHLSTY